MLFFWAHENKSLQKFVHLTATENLKWGVLFPVWENPFVKNGKKCKEKMVQTTKNNLKL